MGSNFSSKKPLRLPAWNLISVQKNQLLVFIFYYPIYWSLKIVPFPFWVPYPYHSTIQIIHHVGVPDKITPQDELMRVVQSFLHPILKAIFGLDGFPISGCRCKLILSHFLIPITMITVEKFFEILLISYFHCSYYLSPVFIPLVNPIFISSVSSIHHGVVANSPGIQLLLTKV